MNLDIARIQAHAQADDDTEVGDRAIRRAVRIIAHGAKPKLQAVRAA